MMWSSRNFALLGCALILPSFAAPAQSVPEPPPPLEDFWLEPGQPQQPAPPPAEQGPSTPETAPRPTPREAPPEVQARPAPPQDRPAGTRNTAPVPTEQPAASAPPPAVAPLEGQTGNTLSQEANPTRNEAPPASASEPPAQQSEEPTQSLSTDETDGGARPWLAWWWLALPLLALGGLIAAWLVKRRSAASLASAEAEDNVPSPAAKGPPASPLRTGTAAPEPPPANPVSPGGFVTTRLTLPKPTAAPPQPAAPVAPPRTTKDGPVDVELIVDKGVTTLVNAVVEYRIKLRNRSDSPLRGILVDAVLQQAQTPAVDNTVLAARHDCELLPAGAVAEVNGELKMPLNSIQPIAVRDRKIFVPMISLSLVATDMQGQQHRQQHAFLVGQEHRPPDARMAPFRLDLGPRSFAPVGTRALEPA